MCGIVGYFGRPKKIKTGLAALKRLEYRGYDSAGFAFYNPQKKEVFCFKKAGRIDALEKEYFNNGSDSELEVNPSILHTRWATHGGVTDANAHPHCDCKKNIWLAHNGIVENYKELKESLQKEGHVFSTETDTEVIAHLVENHFEGNLEEAVRKALREIRGAYALVVIARDDPDKMVAARFSSPLLLGISSEGDYIVASDATALLPHTNKVINLDDNEIAVMTKKDFFILKERQPEVLEMQVSDIQKGGYPHFMLKEIMEGPEAVENSLKGRLVPQEGMARLGGLQNVEKDLRKTDRLNIVACGTAYHSGMVGEYMIEEYVGIPVEVDVASEFRYRKPVLGGNTALLAISQSGETADTLAAVKEAKRKDLLTLGIVNSIGSSLVRETAAGVYNHIGPEIGVAATKSFISQLTILSLMTLYLGRQRNLSLIKGQRLIQDLQKLPLQIKEILDKEGKHIKKLADKYSKYNNFIYLGRKYNYPIAMEGALKLKEIAYPIHAEGLAGGEMKHGPLALADENFPFVFIAPSDSIFEKTISNMQEVKARKAPIIAVVNEDGKDKLKGLADDVICIPKTSEMLTPILSVVPLQLFAYHMGIARGCDVDKPRNLAKSVTVE